MLFDVEIHEIMKILENGSTNQQAFVEKLDSEDELKTALELFEKCRRLFNIPDTFRGAINGGALYITNDDVDDWLITTPLINGTLVFDWRLY